MKTSLRPTIISCLQWRRREDGITLFGSHEERVIILSNSIDAWCRRWMELANYQGPSIPDAPDRIEQLISHWQEPIPGQWQRGVDSALLVQHYRRSDVNQPHPGEHKIECEILSKHFDLISCYGGKLIDGVNALPLVKDAKGGRAANVEADMLLLTERDGVHRLFLCEVKHQSNNAWYAAIESLRQLRLMLSNPESRNLFARRNSTSSLAADLPVTALVLAPDSFYSSAGKKANAVKPTLELIGRFKLEFNLDVRLAVWDCSQQEIRDWDVSKQLNEATPRQQL